MTTVKLSKKNQMVLPRAARQHLRVGPGDRIIVIEKRNGTVLLARSKDIVTALKGTGRDVYQGGARHLRRERASWE